MSPIVEDEPNVLLVTRSDIDHGRLGTVAVLSMQATAGPSRPATLGPQGMSNLYDAIADVAVSARDGEIAAVVLTGNERAFLAGADLTVITADEPTEAKLPFVKAGHQVVRALRALPIPSLAHITGPALGGGLEIALACQVRIAVEGVRNLGLPETALGIVPGWGGCTLLPHLIGQKSAAEIIISMPLRDKLLSADKAQDMGIVDHIVPAGIDYALAALSEWIERDQPASHATPVSEGDLEQFFQVAKDLDAGGNPGPLTALEIIAAAGERSLDASFAAEEDALISLAQADHSRAAIYAATILRQASSAAKKEAKNAPSLVTRVGILGAGLMAAQIGLVLAKGLQVPVVLRDLDQDRADAGKKATDELIEQDVAAGRMSRDDAAALANLITASTTVSDLAGCDLVIEAIVEQMEPKQAALAEVESVVSDTAVLATNTSGLNISTMGARLHHPERLIGLHFFNPVARMPLVEVIRTRATNDATADVARAVVSAAGKVGVDAVNAPGFIVNRVLMRLLSEVLSACEKGLALDAAQREVRPMGLPMGPFELLDLVGTGVADDVLQTLHNELGPRFTVSPGLRRASEERIAFTVKGGKQEPAQISPAAQALFTHDETADGDGLLSSVLDALAEEVGLMLDDGVVSGPREIDLAMMLGAGWPRHRGGITPYLDSSGASERTLSRLLKAHES